MTETAKEIPKTEEKYLHIIQHGERHINEKFEDQNRKLHFVLDNNPRRCKERNELEFCLRYRVVTKENKGTQKPITFENLAIF